jgi:hypothetical protein
VGPLGSQRRMKKIVLLLTGTVNPKGMTFTKLLDPALRRSQYISTLNAWLEITDLPIVFIENSGVDLSDEIDKRHSGRLEFLTFNGNDYPKDLGKGYGELKCIQHASQNSVLLKNCDFVFKVTGRLRVLNFERFVLCFRKNEDVFIFLDFKASLTFADSRIFGFRPAFLNDYLLKRQEEANDSRGIVFENILAKAALEAIVDGKTFQQLPVFPRIVGISGTDNRPYKSNFLFFGFKQVKYFLKSRFMGGY